MSKFLQSLYIEEDAQGATEYILMLVIVVGIAVMFKDKIMSIIGTKISTTGEQINNF